MFCCCWRGVVGGDTGVGVWSENAWRLGRGVDETMKSTFGGFTAATGSWVGLISRGKIIEEASWGVDLLNALSSNTEDGMTMEWPKGVGCGCACVSVAREPVEEGFALLVAGGAVW